MIFSFIVHIQRNRQIYRQTYTHILLCLYNVTCIHMFSELTIWLWITNWNIFPGENSSSHSQNFLAACSFLRRV